MTRTASDDVEAARAAQADIHAPYWFTLAVEYLRKAREEAAEADFQAANRLGRQGVAGGAQGAVRWRPAARPGRPNGLLGARSGGDAAGARCRAGARAAWRPPVLGASCAAGQRVRGEIDTVERTIEVARGVRRRAAARRSTSARAVAHSEFAALELDEGDYYSARAELDVAARSAGQALRLSPRGRCAAAATTGGADRDGDGVPDDRDECMAQPEDRDGAQDDDGCPETDNDSDGLADAVDRCPDDAEDSDGFDDDDGCPEADNDRDGLVDRIDQCPEQGRGSGRLRRRRRLPRLRRRRRRRAGVPAARR